MKTLFNLEKHPYLKIQANMDTLVITFQDSYSSESLWHEIVLKYDKKTKYFLLSSQKPS